MADADEQDDNDNARRPGCEHEQYGYNGMVKVHDRRRVLSVPRQEEYPSGDLALARPQAEARRCRARSSPPRADRRFIALANSDTGAAGGLLPSIFLGIQIINPGEHIVPHRHNSYALYHIIQGSAYSIVGDHKFEWSRGHTFACSAWAAHEHFNTGTEPAIQYVIQDMPARAMDRNLIWEEPVGHMFHMVDGNLPHSD